MVSGTRETRTHGMILDQTWRLRTSLRFLGALQYCSTLYTMRFLLFGSGRHHPLLVRGPNIPKRRTMYDTHGTTPAIRSQDICIPPARPERFILIPLKCNKRLCDMNDLGHNGTRLNTKIIGCNAHIRGADPGTVNIQE